MASGLLAFVLLFSPFHLSYAATQLTTAPTLSDSTTTSLSIDWEEIEGAAAYYVYYDVKSGVEDGYASGLSDTFDVPGAEITNLEPGTTYYVAITVFDKNGEESNFSPEGVFTTKTTGGAESFALESIEVASKDTLHLHFNADLDDAEDAEREFKITSDTAGYHEYSVIETELVSPEVLAVTLDEDMIVWREYDVTVITLTDADGRNIESGVDGITTITVDEIPVEQVEVAPQETATEPEVELQAAEETVVETTDTQAADAEALPQAGPEHILLILLSLIITFAIFAISKAKRV